MKVINRLLPTYVVWSLVGLLLCPIVVAQDGQSQTEKWGLPPSPNGKVIAALMNAVNESDAAVHQKFIETHFTPAFINAMPMEVHLDAFQQMHEDLAGGEINGIDMMMGATAKLKMIIRVSEDSYYNMSVDLEQGDSPKVAGLSVGESEDGPPPTEHMLEALLNEAINKSSADDHRKFIESYFSPAFKDDLPMDEHLALLKQMNKDLAGAEVLGVDAMSRGGSDETVNIEMRTKSGDRYRVTFDMQASSPPRLITLKYGAAE